MAVRDSDDPRSDPVDALARRLGVVSSYLDQNDARVAISRETQIALVEALGFPATTPALLRVAQERLDAQRAGPLPAWLVVNAGEACKTPLSGATTPTRWLLTGEDGFENEQAATGAIDIPALTPGYYHLSSAGRAAHTLVIAAPCTCWIPPAFLADDAKSWGVSAQAYGLRSDRNYGFGDFTDIATLAKAAEQRGASFLGLSPLHALFASDRSKISPYSPSSRLFLEPLYLDPDRVGVADASAWRARIDRLRAAPLVDYREAWEVKRALLEQLFKKFTQSGADASRAGRTAALGDALQLHATFEALSEHFTAQGQTWAGVWPQDYFDPSSAAVARFRRDHGERIAFHAWLQALCDEQLEDAARAQTMEIGLYRDLAVGADRYGSEVWARPDRYALSLSVGAPPDPLGPQGQNWGFPPFNPIALEEQDFAGFRDLVTANMRHAGAIRIDHAFQLQRLFLVPPGATAEHGGYVEFPFEALLAILRLESHRHRCMVIAEDLGTGPAGFSEKIMQSGLLSYRILPFERTKQGGFVPPHDYPRAALAALTTHDLPTFKGWRRGFDIDLRSHFGVYSEAQARDEHQGRARDIVHWRDALRAEGLAGELEEDASARNDALRFLARAPSALVAVQIEDMLDEINQANLPGLSEGPPNWRRRMSEEIACVASGNGPLGRTGALMASEGRTLRPRQARLADAPPRATYRLQFQAGFTFDMARENLPYLKKLGISHVYCSPIQKARKGSTHGYDIVDPREINPELGGRAAIDRFAEDAHALGLKLIVDIVPNHMGIGVENRFWNAVLKWGEASPCARLFDIDFQRGGGKVMLPVLGKPYAQALEAREIALAFDAQQGFVIRYFNRAFPVAPTSYATLLGGHADPGFEREETFERALRELLAAGPAGLDEICEAVSADPDRLDALLHAQHFRLAHWRLAASDINYRRFFEINALAGVRVEDEQVFAFMHELIFDLVERGQIDGLRIDHVDGLADPKSYLERLQQRVGPGFYVIVEKILERGERLKPWPVAGTTGYDALNELDGVLVSREARDTIAAFYRETVGEKSSYERALEEAKSFILERSFGAECERLAEELFSLAQCDRRTGDLSYASLRRVLRGALVALPVYRTYVMDAGPDAADHALLTRTMDVVHGEAAPADRLAADFLREVLCAEIKDCGDLRRAFEQLTGPLMAKGLEDTLFYRHAPLLALNEVGADPSCFGYSREAFDEAVAARARDWPASLIATATHDTKRGEDARARLLAMTADPKAFCEEAARFLDRTEGADRNDRFILFQALVAAWPLNAETTGDDFVRRAREFLRKAMREAKRRSSWTDPDEAYESAALALVDRCLAEPELRDILSGLSSRFAWAGALNGLARTLLKLTLPGVSDFYQGAEVWDFSFVDPDNRRPVDFLRLSGQLDGSSSVDPRGLLNSWRDGRIKQWLIARLLAERAADPELFAYGDYEAQPCESGVAFIRRHQGRTLFVCVPTDVDMMKRGLLGAEGGFDAQVLWKEETLTLEQGAWRNLLTGSAFAVERAMACADVAEGLPWLILGT